MPKHQKGGLFLSNGRQCHIIFQIQGIQNKFTYCYSHCGWLAILKRKAQVTYSYNSALLCSILSCSYSSRVLVLLSYL